MKGVKNRKSLVVILSLAIVLCMAIGGTLAWLIDTTEVVENTFTYGDIDIKLDETKTDEDGNPVVDPETQEPEKTTEGNEYKMLPGEEYLKDPAVTAEKNNEKFWLFVKLTETGEAVVVNGDGTSETYDFDDFLTYEIADGWTPLQVNDNESVYFRLVEPGTEDQVFTVLKDDKIAVKGEVTKEMLNALDDNGQKDKETATYPKLNIKAYGIQYSGFEATPDSTDDQATAADKAWAAIKDQVDEQ